MLKKLLILLCLCAGLGVRAQETFPVNGVRDERHIFHAFTNATVHITPEKRMDAATLLVRDGRVVGVVMGGNIPKNAVVHDCSGKHIYPSFVDAYSGMNTPQKNADAKQPKPATSGNWNPAIHPEYAYEQSFPMDKKTTEDWLASGFGVVNLHARDGIMRGTSQLMVLGPDAPNEAVLKSSSCDHYSFSKGTSTDDYPSSLVGAIALIRQTFLDAQWYANGGNKQETNPSLEALTELGRPQIFELNHPLGVRNVRDIGSEAQRNFIMVGTGREYLVAGELGKDARLILPLNFPKAYDMSDPYMARMVALEELKHWELAPFNARILVERGIRFALSRDTLRSHKEFLDNLRKTTAAGLSHEKAMDALTRIPAEFLAATDFCGSLETDKPANFFIANKPFTEAGFRVEQHWTKGKKAYEAKPSYEAMVGTYSLVIAQQDFTFTVKTADEIGIQAELKKGATALKAKVTREGDLVSIVVSDSTPAPLYRLSGKITLNGGVWDGNGQDTAGNWITWAAIRSRETAKPASTVQGKKQDSIPSVPALWFPNKAFGRDTLSDDSEDTFVITNVVVWTASDQGVIQGADVFVENGKIKSVGTNTLFPSGVKRVNGNGMHLTPGIIDEHSHIALRGGVNEWAQASSAEVRMADAIDPWNINIYRHLAGGVTTAQLLHGSANPIGGQSAIVKLKWGRTASEMLVADAPGSIKFALGENVKRANVRDQKGRFPLTRMGVEQTFADAFVRAREYQPNSQVPSGKKKNATPAPATSRRDLELDAIREILDGTRHITCHSYVQSEILMLMNLADSLRFKVNTFTHILEGYKVSREMKANGVNASTFSDWWAYKFEVNDAIPYNAAMLTKAGVCTGINSDDAEMGRRLNQEAAKTMKYGGLTPEDAIKLITINPAKMLHIDHRTGSIEAGKDADLVLWSGNPLSVYSHVEKTFIEGQLYYESSRQKKLEEAMQKERARITAKMMADSSHAKQKPTVKEEKHIHCDTMFENYLEE